MYKYKNKITKKQMKSNQKIFVIGFILALALSSCQKDVLLEEMPTFRQTAYIEQNVTGDSILYPAFVYSVAVLADIPIDEIKVELTVVLKDGNKIVLTEKNLVNWSQLGFYAPECKYPKYWISRCYDLEPIKSYHFTEKDVARFEYKSQVNIQGQWYTLPLEGRNIDGPFDSINDGFWI